MIGSFAITQNGNFIAALQEGFALIDRISGEKNIIATPEKNAHITLMYAQSLSDHLTCVYVFDIAYLVYANN